MDMNTLSDDARAVARAERELADAHLSMDLRVIDRLLHHDYKIIQPGGAVENKNEVLASYRGGKRHWERAEVDQLDVRVRGDTAWVTGRWRASGVNNGESFEYSARFLSIWIYEDGRWQNVAYLATEIT